MAKEAKDCWFPFYPKDWLSDERLKLASLAARGLWADLTCLMHQGEPYGHLRVAGLVLGPREVASLVGRPLPEVTRAWRELEKLGVPDIGEDGCWSSRRMVRDREIRRKRAAGGKLGGNPNLLPNQDDNQKVNHPPNLQVGEKENHEPRAPAIARALASGSQPSGSVFQTREVRREVAADTSPDDEDQVLLAEFEQFWSRYPVPAHLEDAQHAWIETRHVRPPLADLLAALAALAASPRWRQDGGRFVPKPARWLRERGWLDRPGPRSDGFVADPKTIASFNDVSPAVRRRRERLAAEAAGSEAAAAAAGGTST